MIRLLFDAFTFSMIFYLAWTLQVLRKDFDEHDRKFK